MKSARNQAATAGLVLFVALSFLGSWLVAASLRVLDLNVQPAPLGTRLFATSLLYAVTMGWQPLVATWVVRRWVEPPDRLDLGLQSCRGVFSLVGCVAALGFAAAATALAWAAGATGATAAPGPSPLHGNAEQALGATPPSLGGLLSLTLAFVGTLVLVWAQAFTEEVAWRGYFLPRAMERFGRWGGLLLHGAVWGLWYAPVLFFSSHGQLAPLGSVVRSLGFVVSCILLGTLLGWLRLASRSVVPVVLANSTLTLAAGLPYVVLGVDAGLRSAIFGPAGWLLLATTIAILIASRWRAVVQVPLLPEPVEISAGSPRSSRLRIAIVVEGRERPRGRRTLH